MAWTAGERFHVVGFMLTLAGVVCFHTAARRYYRLLLLIPFALVALYL